MTITRSLFECPYCENDQGDLFLDAEQLAAFARELPQPFNETFADRPEVKFLSHSQGDRRCRHIVDVWVDVMCWEVGKERRKWRGEVFLLSGNPWLTATSANMAVRSLLNDYVAAEDFPFGHCPTSPHRIDDPNHEFYVEHGGSKWLLAVNCVFVVAKDPLVFLGELSAINQRLAETPCSSNSVVERAEV